MHSLIVSSRSETHQRHTSEQSHPDNRSALATHVSHHLHEGAAIPDLGLHLQRHPDAKQLKAQPQGAASQVAEGQAGGSLPPLGLEHR